jgi:hypothetical protein
MFGFAVRIIDFSIIDSVKVESKIKMVYVWIYLCKSKLNKKFVSKNQL